MNLYELKNQKYELLQYFSEEMEGSSILLDTLNSIDEATEEKIENLMYVIKNLSAQYDGIKIEKDRLEKKMKAIDNRIIFLKEYAKFGMETLGKTKLETALFNVSLRKSEVVEVEDITKLHEAFKVWSDPKPNKKAIKEAIKGGLEVPGASIKQNTSLQIR